MQMVSEGPNLQLTFISLPFQPKDGGFLIEYVFVKQSSITPQVSAETSAIIPLVPFEKRVIKESTEEIFAYLRNNERTPHSKDATAIAG